MFDPRRGADRAVAGDNGNVETDPSGRYGRFNEVLGKGATKAVYRAFDELNGMEVAWNQAKLSDVLRSPEALQRMYSEVHLLSTLNHNSIIRFYSSWIDINNRTFNFITELFTSGTLREYRQKYRRVDIRAVKNWANQILNGLVYLHGHDPPVIHRDLKCDNIFVNGHLGQVKIGDLGLAAVLRESQNAHSVIGTPEFMAPELYEEEYNELVDIYSFGMCVLEMLTAEYPYSECSNPAQIYKKVTSGKLPEAFHRISDSEAKRFIGRCLETASKRPTAKELLSDPFLLSHNSRNPMPTSKGLGATLKPRDTGGEDIEHRSIPAKRTDMTITGKLNPEDDTIFLKVKIANKDGNVRNIYFPFDIISDTPIDVANEMVKELELTEREPSKIAEVIAKEITMLVPGWKEKEPPTNEHHQEYIYGEDIGHPFNCMPSSPTSSHMSEFGAGSSHAEHCWPAATYQADWLQDDLFTNNDDASSVHSGKYSAMNYHSADDQNIPPCLHKNTEVGATVAAELKQQCSIFPPPESPPRDSLCRRGKKTSDGRKLSRNQSMVDVRSQLLNKTLLDGLKRRLFKTVGAVENIGFQMPYDDSRGKSPSTSPSRGVSKKQGFIWGRS